MRVTPMTMRSLPEEGSGRATTRPVRGRARHSTALVLVVSLPLLAGCVSQGDFLRLQERVAEHHSAEHNEPDPFARIAQLSNDVDALRQEVRDLQGELELARKQAADALQEVARTRSALASDEAPVEDGEAADGQAADEAEAVAEGDERSPDQELAGYQTALDAWRDDDFPGCIEQFTAFLQAWPNSGYADDAAYWLADCTYKNGEFKRAVVRFNAVVSVYPQSPKAPDALYRQGESLLKLGPKFHEAARTVFKNVRKEYPDSERANEAARQLERLGAG